MSNPLARREKPKGDVLARNLSVNWGNLCTFLSPLICPNPSHSIRICSRIDCPFLRSILGGIHCQLHRTKCINCKHVVAVLLEGLQEQHPPAPVPVISESTPSLRYEVKSWLSALGNMAEARATDPDAYPDDIRQRLVYVLDPSDARARIATRYDRCAHTFYEMG